MLDMINGENLPGYKKKSFAIPYNGGEIWIENLDGMYGYEDHRLFPSQHNQSYRFRRITR